MKDIWSDVLGGRYQVSRTGLVRNDKGHILKPCNNGNGYLYITVKGKHYYVHRLVAEAFCEKPDGSSTINHLDYNKANNAASNLMWCTQGDNVRYSAIHMKKEKKIYRKSATGEKYITVRDGRYRVNISRKGIDRSFRTIGEAIAYRNEVMLDA